MDNLYPNKNKFENNSRKTLTRWFFLFLLTDFLIFGFVFPDLSGNNTWLFLVYSLAAGMLWSGIIWFGLTKYSNDKSSERPTSMGLPNHLTIFRGFLIAIIAGLVVVPSKSLPIAWLPGSLFLCAILIDGLDGIVARKTGKATSLGEFLDIEMDSITVLIGSIAVFIYGKAGFLILVVGAARYLFVGGLWLLKKLDKPVNSLRQKPIRRALAGLMMGFLAASILPVFYPLAIKVVSYFVILPFLINFLDDWFQVSGNETPSREKVLAFGKNGLRIINRWLLPGLRIIIILQMLLVSVQIRQASNLSENALWMLVILSLGLLTGTAGRLSAVGLVILVSLETNVDSFIIPNLLILISSCIILLFGTGRFSFWKPEDFFIFHRVAEHDQS
ncbi:MAG: CDP-alcohol phosphatidyltransferase family protein [Anaerolineaceae bacterium]